MASIRFPYVPSIFDDLLDRLTSPDGNSTLINSNDDLIYNDGTMDRGCRQ